MDLTMMAHDLGWTFPLGWSVEQDIDSPGLSDDVDSENYEQQLRDAWYNQEVTVTVSDEFGDVWGESSLDSRGRDYDAFSQGRYLTEMINEACAEAQETLQHAQAKVITRL